MHSLLISHLDKNSNNPEVITGQTFALLPLKMRKIQHSLMSRRVLDRYTLSLMFCGMLQILKVNIRLRQIMRKFPTSALTLPVL